MGAKNMLSALNLAILAKRRGARFDYSEGRLVANLRLLPPGMRDEVEARLGDVLACVHEHSVPCNIGAGFVLDAARAIVRQSEAV